MMGMPALNSSATSIASPFATAWALAREQFTRPVVSHRAAFLCSVVAVTIGFTNPLAMSLTEILLGVMAGCWLLAGGFRDRIRTIIHNPVALAALAMLSVLSLSVLYGEAPMTESLRVLAKYRNLLYLVLFITIFRTARLREAGLWAFGAAMVLTLAGSIMTAIGMPLLENRYTANPEDATVFRNHIIHGLCMGLFAYLMAHRFMEHPRWRWFTGPLTLLAMYNVLFMVGGRTGYVTLATMVPLFCSQRLRFRGLACVLATFGGVAVAGYFYSDTFSERVGLAIEEFDAYFDYRSGDGPWHPEGWRSPVTRTSCGIRLDWYRAGLGLFAQNPWLGVGVGSVKHCLESAAEETGTTPTHNLHSEYVMAAAQNGLLGIVLLATLFVAYWRASRRLSTPMRHLAEGMLLTMIVAGVPNTLITERTEGVLFAFCSGLVFGEFSERAIRRRENLPADEGSAAEEDRGESLAPAA